MPAAAVAVFRHPVRRVRGADMSDRVTVPPDPRMAQLVYALYLLSIFFGPILFAGLVIAYDQKTGASDQIKSHYRFQIRTAWMYVFFGVVIAFPALFVLGLAAMEVVPQSNLVLALCGFAVIDVLLWFLIRCVRGLILAVKGKPIPNPASWAFGG